MIQDIINIIIIIVACIVLGVSLSRNKKAKNTQVYQNQQYTPTQYQNNQYAPTQGQNSQYASAQRQNGRFCPYCGMAIENQAFQFCPSCGNKI